MMDQNSFTLLSVNSGRDNGAALFTIDSFKCRRLWKGETMKPSRVIELIGGCVAVLAFFLPWITFIISFSLFDVAKASPQLGSSFSGAGLAWLEPLAGAALLVFALLAGNMGKSAHGIGLVGALAGLGVVIYVYAQVQSALNGSFFQGVSATSLLGAGFWIAALAFIAGLVGAIMGLREAPAMAPLPPISGQIGTPPQPPMSS